MKIEYSKRLPACFVKFSARRSVGACYLALLLVRGAATAQMAAAPPTQTQKEAAPGKPFTSDQVEAVVPATVFFRGKTAPVQMRNAGGVRFADGGTFFAAMVDSSGYSSSVQETYQFYLLTENAVRFGGQTLQPGAYGAGFVKDRFVVMDIGGHTVLQGDTVEDKGLLRPRPLQVMAASSTEVRLYLGRRYVLVSSVRPEK